MPGVECHDQRLMGLQSIRNVVDGVKRVPRGTGTCSSDAVA
jgi:hypothetical protein